MYPNVIVPQHNKSKQFKAYGIGIVSCLLVLILRLYTACIKQEINKGKWKRWIHTAADTDLKDMNSETEMSSDMDTNGN